MKRATLWLLVTLSLSGCALPFHAAASPRDALTVALQTMLALKTAQADFTRDQIYHLPADYPSSLPAGLEGPPHTYKLDLSGTGEVAFPDRFHYIITVRIGPTFHTGMELISVQGIIYEQDGVHVDFGGKVTPTWSKRDPKNLLLVDPFKTLQGLKDTVTPRDLGDTTIEGVRVHHYAMEMDKAKLIAREAAALADPGLQSALQDVIQKGTFHIEAWIGIDDHLIRRIRTDETRSESIALRKAESDNALPVGASDQGIVASSDQVVLNFHDFNRPVTITPPPNVR